MNDNKFNVVSLLLTLIVAIGSSLASTSYFTGKYVQQILSNTDRILVLETRGGEMESVIYSLKEDSAVNRTNVEWIKAKLSEKPKK